MLIDSFPFFLHCLFLHTLSISLHRYTCNTTESNKAIQLESFHVFKLFVANQNKPPEIVSILVTNRSKLLRFFGDFNIDKEDDQFEADKAQVIREITNLNPRADDVPRRIQANLVKPTSPWMKFHTLLSVLSKVLPPHKMTQISKYHCDFHRKKITRQQLVKRLRQIAGDEMLTRVIKLYRTKGQTSCVLHP